jgi:hypothetical protein
MNSLLKVGKWLDDDKDYQLSTQEKYDEFVKKRNYKFSSDGGVLGFDRAKSRDADDPTGVVVKSKHR